MTPWFPRWFALLLFAALTCLAAGEDAELRPPFGLSWGETAPRLESMLKAAGAKVQERRDLRGRDCWTVTGLVQPGLKRTLFYFSGGLLDEVELQYEQDSWDNVAYESFMAQVRARIEQRYGAGKLIARSKAPEDKVMQTVIGYQWAQSGTVLHLFYYSAESEGKAWRTVSLHYKRG